ncbi:hypothetical protein IWW49_000846 [Coemansia sp. RSA 1797]|nr:hypothetical protein IWW49_000846 [Coemansia sp. RSA 1797]
MSKQFVKESELSYQKSAHSWIPTTVHRHTTGLRVVQCKVQQPIYTLAIYVPTLPENDTGEPHTLEHLVFCGSKRFAHRGYLDALALCNFSQGTNAWTYEDVTCYTLTTASEEALANVMAVYLDHVLSPQLRDEQFVTEVYHYDSKGREHGVVFSEVLGSESEEAEVGERRMLQLLFGEDAAYAKSFGGLTRSVAQLTNAEVAEYHKRFYDACNITMVVTGPVGARFEQALEDIPPEILHSSGHDSRRMIPINVPEGPVSARVLFAADSHVGSVQFGWRGPMGSDVETVTALEILLEYLTEEASSPLSMRFVECKRPVASSVVGYVKQSIPTTMFIGFDGVPYGDGGDSEGESGDEDESDDESEDEGKSEDEEEEESEPEEEDESKSDESGDDITRLLDEGYFAELLKIELERIYTTKFDGDAQALRRAVEQYGQRLAKRMESHADDTLQTTIGIDIVASHFATGKFAVGTRARIFDVVAELAQRPIEYWLELLKTWLMDARTCHVCTVPDATMSARLDAERQQIEEANAATVVDAAAHDQRIALAVEANRVDLPATVRAGIPEPDAGGTSALPHTQLCAEAHGPLAAVQVLRSDTQFVNVRLHVPMAAMPEALRPFLALFQGLLFNTDVQLPVGAVHEGAKLTEPLHVSYAAMDQQLAELTTSRGSSVGMGVEPFVSSWTDEVFVVSLHTTPEKYADAVRCIVQAIVFGSFVTERISTVAQNLLADIAQIKRDGRDVLTACVARLSAQDQVGRPRWITNHVSLFDQERVLRQVMRDAASVAVYLDEIRRVLVHAPGMFLSLGMSDTDDAQQLTNTFVHEWQTCMDAYSQYVPISEQPNDPFAIPRESRLPQLSEPLRVHVTLRSIQASFAAICVPCALREHPPSEADFDTQLARLPARDFYALQLLLELLHRTDGPLFNAVRGMGLAYGAYFELRERQGQLMFLCSRASNVSGAILAMRALVERVGEHWDEYVGAFEVAMARSALVFSAVDEQVTPGSVLMMCVVSAIDGFASVDLRNKWRAAHLRAVTIDDMRRVFDTYVRRLVDPQVPAIHVVLTPPGTQLEPELGSFSRRSLNEI